MNNTIMLVGNVTGEVKLVKTPDGSEVANFSVAVTRYYDKAKKEQVTDFFDCVAWKELAKNIAASIKKGTRVILSGKIITDTWEDDEGKKKTKAKVSVNNIGPDLSFASCENIVKNANKTESQKDETNRFE